jgi:hypothetical protein
VCKNQVDSGLVSTVDGMGMATIHEKPTTMLCLPQVQWTVFDEWWYGDLPLCINFHEFLHHPLFSRRANSATPWHEMCMGAEIIMRIPLHIQYHSCSIVTKDFSKN